MSFKTLLEKFGEPGEMLNSPMDFQDEITILAVPDGALPDVAAQAAKPEGTTLNMPNVPQTKTVEVVEAPETFKGDLPHLAPEEHEAVKKWFDKASTDENTPLEVRKFLVDIAMALSLDAKKRIVPKNTESGIGE
jgi:hypothetical protein